MSCRHVTEEHSHSESCSHKRIRHENHVGYLHDGALHCQHENHTDAHVLSVSKGNPENCTDGHQCAAHDDAHVHGANCGHEQVPHGAHLDYLVNGHLHHQHSGHCDHHGAADTVCHTHEDHQHSHGAHCGHTAILHDGHIGYLHGGHLHCVHDGHIDEHVIAVSATNQAACTPAHGSTCKHEAGHVHHANCGHPAVPHGDHVDYLVGNHLHHPCAGGHCDHHGEVRLPCAPHAHGDGHRHGDVCGHVRVQHEDHIDFLHEGVLDHAHGDHYDVHTLTAGSKNPAVCTPTHQCAGHAKDHVHSRNCGHRSVVHDDHIDYLVDGHLHHVHLGHCDHHGPLVVV